MCTYILYYISWYLCVLTVITTTRLLLTTRGILFVISVITLGFQILLFLSADCILNVNNTAIQTFNIFHHQWLSLIFTWAIRIDSLSFLFVFLINSIVLATNLYTLNYFKYEPKESQFILLINWFAISMMILVLADNLFTLFLGWELIGLTSYLLINFWYTKRGTFKASFKAFTFNRVSDIFLLLFCGCIWRATETTNIYTLNLLIDINVVYNTNLLYYGCLCLIACASIKSAQFIGHLWLPDSMEAPVPASALIHSATLVSAGIYLLVRFNLLLEYVGLTSTILMLGAITAAFGGLVACAQTDMKKLLAYSTISHCGFLFLIAGLNNHKILIIYLVLHGWFKASTFFCSGSFIRVSGSQDTRQHGNLTRIMPIDTILLIISATNLCGMPFTVGYFYKTSLMALLLTSKIHWILLGFCIIGLLTSVVYFFRLVYYCAFDFQKHETQITVMSLYISPHNLNAYWSLTTLAHIWAVCLLFIISGVCGTFMWIYFFKTNLTHDWFPVYIDGLRNIVEEATTLSTTSYTVIYNAYLYICFSIILVVCRFEFTYQTKLYILLLMYGNLLFLTIISYLFNVF